MKLTPLLRSLVRWSVVAALVIPATIVLVPFAYRANRADPVRDTARDYDLGHRDEITAQALRCFSMADRFKTDPKLAARWHSEGLRLARIAAKGLPAK